MRVALAHHSLARIGGMERYLLDVVAGFRAAGDSVEVFARDINLALAPQLGVPVHALHVPSRPRLLRQTLLARAVANLRLRERFDLSLSLTRAPGTHAYVCGGTHPQYLESMTARAGLRDRLEIRCERSAVCGGVAVVAHSHGLAQELQRHYGYAATRCRVLYPPVDTAHFHPRAAHERAAVRERLGLPADRRVFLFPSMGHARKGFDLLLGAFAALAQEPVLLVVAGRRGGGALPANVRELGYCEDMATLYAAVDWTVLPSRYEPFGLALAESLACGTPVIASQRSGVAELMGPGDGIVLERLDVDAVTAAIRQASTMTIEPTDFVQRHGLLLPAHVDALRELARA